MQTLADIKSDSAALTSIDVSQEAYHSQFGKYQQFKLNDLSPDIEIDEYKGPLGDGFIVYEYKIVGKDRFCRKTNYGPETWHSSDWILLK